MGRRKVSQGGCGNRCFREMNPTIIPSLTLKRFEGEEIDQFPGG
jgi:hypothetical protein